MKMTLKTKALLSMISLIVAVSLIFTYESIDAEKKIMQEEIVNRAETITSLATKYGELPILSGSPRLLKDTVAFLKVRSGISAVTFYDQRMTELIHDGSTSSVPPPRLNADTPVSLFEEENFLVFYAPIFAIREQDDADILHETDKVNVIREHIGWVRLIFSKAPMWEAEKKIVERGVRLLLLFAAGSSLLGYFLIDLATRPLSRIVAVAYELAEGDFSQNVDTHRHDEIGVLANAFQRMKITMQKVLRETDSLVLAAKEGRLDSRGNAELFKGEWRDLVQGTNLLVDAFAKVAIELKEAKGSLEERVEQRTAELALANDELLIEIAERKRVEEALRDREARIRRLVESNIIGIFFWDLSGNISEANDAFLQMVGYSRQDILCGNVHWGRMTPSEYRALDEQKAAEVRETRRCSPYEKEYLRKDGSRVPVLIGAVLLDGSQDHGVAFVLDLTERKQAEAEREARRAAETANRAKSAFLANMSHELRTPLNGILGYAQILQRDKTLDERQLAGLNVIRQSGEHLLTLINDVLDLSKIEAGKMELYLADIELARFVHTIVEMVGVKAAQKGLDFICDIAPDVPRWIRGDEKLLRQVLLNLLSNAVKFTDCGQVTLRVHFAPPARLRFEVRDTGMGIDADQLDAIFQPFEQVGDAQRRAGGTGLGLTLSRQYVRLMGSNIHVESRRGQGSAFWFELEVSAVEAATVTGLTRIVTGYAGPRKMVLVVDDVAENRAVAADMLKPLGFEVVEATNGREGLETAQSLRPHLILMDLVMPEMDGLEAACRLRRLADFKEVPIIAVSAGAADRDHDKSVAAGINAFLLKPIDLDELLRQIAMLLQLDWTYGLPGAKPSLEPEASGPLVVPPQQEMEVLYRLARRGNMQEILERATYLAELDPSYRPLASQLRSLAKGYQSKAILSLVEQCLKRSQVQ